MCAAVIISEREKERGIESTICYRIFSLSLSSCERDISAWACVFGKLCEGVSVYFAKFLWRQHEILHGTSVDSFHTHYNSLSHTLTFISLSISSLSVFHMLVSLSLSSLLLFPLCSLHTCSLFSLSHYIFVAVFQLILRYFRILTFTSFLLQFPTSIFPYTSLLFNVLGGTVSNYINI